MFYGNGNRDVGGRMKTNDNNTVLMIILVVTVLLLFGGFGMMGFRGCFGGGMMGGFYGLGSGFMGSFGWLFMILFWVALVLFILWIVKQLQKAPRRK